MLLILLVQDQVIHLLYLLLKEIQEEQVEEPLHIIQEEVVEQLLLEQLVELLHSCTVLAILRVRLLKMDVEAL